MSKKNDLLNIQNFVQSHILKEYADLDADTANQFIAKSFESGLLTKADENSLVDWYENRFKPYLFILGESEYTEATIQSLRIQFLIAGTDFGSSRQRDMGQKWADTIRGYLGELGVKQIIQKKFNLDVSLGHEPGTLAEYLPLDIHGVRNNSNDPYRKPNLNISIKTTKSNGIWLDIPGEQFSHSDVYVLSLIGVGVDHLFSFFKHLSVFKDKILKKGLDSNCINQVEADEIYDKVPSFKKIYGYIPGFITSDTSINAYTYEGSKGNKNYTITNWCGKYEESYLAIEKVKQSAGKIQFAGIGQFTQSNRYIFGLKSLKYSDADWKKSIIDRI